MTVRGRTQTLWSIAHMGLVCALIAAFSLGGQVTWGRVLVDQLLCQERLPTNSEEDADGTETSESKTARSEQTPRRHFPRRMAATLVLPSNINPPGELPNQDAHHRSRQPAAIHALVSPLRC